MGLLSERFKEKSTLIRLIGDAIILIGLLALSLYATNEAKKGYEACIKDACKICLNQTLHNQELLIPINTTPSNRTENSSLPEGIGR